MNLRILLAALLTLAPIATAQAAIFNDGNDRKFVKDLRARDSATLTLEEKAILAAASKVGNIILCDGNISANAVYIHLNGRPAVATSAHAVVDRKSGRLNCQSPEKLKSAYYLANVSYFDLKAPDQDKDFVFRRVGLVFPAVNWDDLKNGGVTHEGDVAVFLLQEDISQDRMPDGTLRGFLEFSSQPLETGGLYMIGLAADLGGGKEMTYQERCDGFAVHVRFYHGCDTLKGTSASLMATFEKGALTFRGLHATGTEDTNLHSKHKTDITVTNIATSSDQVRSVSARSRPDFLAYELQWLLTRASCYSGKLDNRWGPGSRKALAAFATAAAVKLPGAEPNAELLGAVEKAAPEGKQVCGP